jgi:5'-nucleotidase
MDPAIDVIITGHTHQAYNCRQVGTSFVRADSTSEGRLVTSASSASRLVTDIDLTLDRRTGDVLTSVSDNVPVSRDVPKDSAQSDLIARYRAFLGPIASAEVGVVDGDIKRTREELFLEGGRSVQGESPLGNLVADAMAAATPDADFALMNPGGVRADLLAGSVTYEEAFNVQPFGNYLTTITLTGAQIQCVLEQQFVVGNDNRNILQPSEDFSYRVDPTGTTGTAADECSGSRVPDESVAIDGVPISDESTYDVTVNNFLADGGDGFTTLTRYSQRVDVADPEDDLAALVDYLQVNRGISAPATDRIKLVGEL